MSRETVIGIDPDSKKYGIAIWIDGELRELLSLDTVELSVFLSENRYPNVKFVVEDVKINGFIYQQHTDNKSKGFAAMIAQSVGKCKQAQTVAEQFIRHNGYELILQKPTKGNWAKNKNMFTRITGWKGRSNEDTRSAAFLAFLYVKQTRVYHAKQNS